MVANASKGYIPSLMDLGEPGVSIAAEERIAALAALPADLTAALGEGRRIEPWDQFLDDAAAADVRVGVTTAMHGLADEEMARFPNLQLVLSQGVGLDRLDLDAASARGVQVSVTPDILTEDVADFAIGLIYAITRRIAEADRFVRAGRWGASRIAPSRSLRDKTVGIVGLGRIGRAIARRAAGLGLSVAYTGQSEKADVDYAFHPAVTDLAASADILVLACSGGPQTRHLCDAAVLGALGPDGFLVNIARGSVVDEAALLQALEAGTIAGAGLDVFASEPALDARFLALDNVVLTPHSASVTREVRAKLIGCMLEELDAHAGGRPLKYVVNRPAEGVTR